MYRARSRSRSRAQSPSRQRSISRERRRGDDEYNNYDNHHDDKENQDVIDYGPHETTRKDFDQQLEPRKTILMKIEHHDEQIYDTEATEIIDYGLSLHRNVIEDTECTENEAAQICEVDKNDKEKLATVDENNQVRSVDHNEKGIQNNNHIINEVVKGINARAGITSEHEVTKKSEQITIEDDHKKCLQNGSAGTKNMQTTETDEYTEKSPSIDDDADQMRKVDENKKNMNENDQINDTVKEREDQ